MNASVTLRYRALGQRLSRLAIAAISLVFLNACSEEETMAGSFKDNLPQAGAPQLVYNVTNVEVSVLESAPLQILITAQGHARTGGWSEPALVHDEDASEGVHLVYRFVAIRPEGMATQAITPITATVTYGPWVDRAGRVIDVISETNTYSRSFPSAESDTPEE